MITLRKIFVIIETINRKDKDIKMRLDKFLAEASVATRTNVREYIKEGNVTVNSVVVLVPETDIDEDKDIIKYLDQHITHRTKQYYMFNKPSGCITARQDANSKTVLDYFTTVNTKALFPVGRLDKDTEGLLFLTNDGTFSHRLTHPDKHVPKRYFFWALGSIRSEDKEKLEEGFSIDPKGPLTRPAKLEIIFDGNYVELKKVLEESLPNPPRLLSRQPLTSGYLTISEGRKHQVKRMLRAVGCGVIYLKRISVGSVTLDMNLEKGQFRELTQEEINVLLGKARTEV